MNPAVGKSGAGIRRASSSISTSGFSISFSIAAQTSPRLWGGMFVAMPTAMPEEPFTRRLGIVVGRTTGSMREPS